MTIRWLAFVAAVGAGAWALWLLVPAGSAPSRTNMVDPAVPSGSDQTRRVVAYYQPQPPAALAAAPVTTGNRFKLVGVVAPRESVAGSEWVALIAVDGEPARAFIVGATVEGDIVLRDVSARGAIIGPREGSVAMALEVSPAPATGTAPVPTAGSGLVSQGPIDSSGESPNLASKYMPLPPQTRENPVDGTSEIADGRWERPSVP